MGNKLADDDCYTYVRSAPSCVDPVTPPTNLSNSCDELIDDYLNYRGCVAAHGSESGFKSPRYRIYLEKRRPLWKTSREAIELIDSNEKTVDLYSY